MRNILIFLSLCMIMIGILLGLQMSHIKYIVTSQMAFTDHGSRLRIFRLFSETCIWNAVLINFSRPYSCPMALKTKQKTKYVLYSKMNRAKKKKQEMLPCIYFIYMSHTQFYLRLNLFITRNNSRASRSYRI